MSEPGDFVPPPQWRTHDFKKAKQDYDAHAGRSYREAVSSGKNAQMLIEPKLHTFCIAPLAIVTDETDSMANWPAIIFSKLPYLEVEGQEYFGKDFEISFSAFGDAHNQENYPLQVRPFSRGVDLKQRLDELVMERKGGGQMMETSELAALYYARNVTMPNAISPIIIFITDEMPYDFILPEHAKQYANVKLTKRLSAKEVFAELKQKWAVYVILKPYVVSGHNEIDVTNLRVYKKWEEIVGSDHIADLPAPERVVDVIFGIFAQEKGRVPYYYKELKERQTPEQVQQATKALKTVHALQAPEEKKPRTGKSVMFPPKK